jgi:hypothetical protein
MGENAVKALGIDTVGMSKEKLGSLLWVNYTDEYFIKKVAL